MESLYSGMSVGFGFLLFCAFLSFIWILFQNFKKRMVPEVKSAGIIDLTDGRVEKKSRGKRTDIIWPVLIKTIDGIFKAETKELSRTGAFVKCSKPLLPGERFHLLIETTPEDSILLNSEVVWSNANIPEKEVVIRGMGIRFIQNRDEDLALLKTALKGYVESVNKTSFQKVAFI